MQCNAVEVVWMSASRMCGEPLRSQKPERKTKKIFAKEFLGLLHYDLIS